MTPPGNAAVAAEGAAGDLAPGDEGPQSVLGSIGLRIRRFLHPTWSKGGRDGSSFKQAI